MRECHEYANRLNGTFSRRATQMLDARVPHSRWEMSRVALFSWQSLKRF